MTSEAKSPEYHISFTIGYQVYSHKVTGTIGGAYMHMGLLIERAEYEVNADRARRGLEPLFAHNRKVRTIERIDPVIRAHMAQVRAYGETARKCKKCK